MTADARVADLVQAGRIRLGLFLPQYSRDSATGALKGHGTGHVAIEVVRALAAKLGVRMEVVEEPTPHSAMEGLKAGRCDVLCLGIEPSRVAQMDFSPPLFQFDYSLMIPPGSLIRRFADADRAGVRIAVVQGHASDLELRRLLTAAAIVGADLPDAGFELLRTGKADAFALPRDVLLDYAAKLPGARVLDEAYGVNRVGIAIAKGQPGRLAFMTEFAEMAKASGLVQRALDSGGLHAFQVARGP